MSRGRKPPGWAELEERFARVAPADLPTEPWVLVRTPPWKAMTPTGGVFARVVDNEAYLRHLRRDLSEGPDGPRGKVVIHDLELLRAALDAHNGERKC